MPRAGVVGMDRELLEVGAVPDGVDATQPDRGSPRNQDDECARELLHGPGPGQRADPERQEHRVGGRLQGGEQRELVGPHRPDVTVGTGVAVGPGVHRPTVACRPVRAVVCNELGPPSLLRVEERPDPVPGPGHVVVDVEAAGVNYVDALFVGGQYQIKPPVPFVPGTESAGRVSLVGESVSGLEAGPARAGLGRAGRLRHQGGCAGGRGDAVARRARRAAGGHVHPELQHLPLRSAGAGRRPAGRVCARPGRRRWGRAGRHRRRPGSRVSGARRGLDRGEAGGGAGGRRRGGGSIPPPDP